MMDWVIGDMSGLKVPAHSNAFLAGGASYPTKVFQATGALAKNNLVAQILRYQESMLAERDARRCSASPNYDPRFTRNALARVQLQLLTVFMNAWQTQNFGAVLDRFIERAERPSITV
jgi:hypothetical protein